MWADSLPAKPPGQLKNTGVGIPSPADLPGPGVEHGSPTLEDTTRQTINRGYFSLHIMNSAHPLFPVRA